jgi:hypothetical protein
VLAADSIPDQQEDDVGLMDLLGGGDRAGLEDFASRFDRGSPWDGFDDQEADDRYRQVAGHLSPQEYEQSTRDVLDRLSPQERRQLGRQLADRSRQQGLDFDPDDDGNDDRYEDPGLLGGLLGGLQTRQPAGLSQLLGGGGGGGGLSKVLLGGIAAMATRRMLGR